MPELITAVNKGFGFVKMTGMKVMRKHLALVTTVSVLLTACGGGGGGGGGSSLQLPTPLICTLAQIEQNGACVSAANHCTADAEKVWVRGHLDDVYLWYNEIQDKPRADYQTPESYFDALLVKSKDHFSFTGNQAEIEAMQESGLDIGYGITWVNDPASNNLVRVAFVEPNSPAASQGIVRGDILDTIDDRSAWSFTQTDFVAALYPEAPGVAKVFGLYNPVAGQSKKVSLKSAELTHDPVPLVSVLTMPDDGKKVGYLLFNDHIATATDKLVNAVSQFKTAKIDDLVLDVRYNGGGYLYIASALAAMIGGQSTTGHIFSAFEYNDKHGADNSARFFEQTDDYARPLPLLNLKRLFVLTSPETCSASEAIINSLMPYMPVIRIGSTTCGKPYGFLQENNCGTTYFAIRFKGVNSIGQTVPVTGYAPTCAAGDNLDFALGDSREKLLATALYYRSNGSCPLSSLSQSRRAVQPDSVQEVKRAPWRNNMMLR